MITVPIDIYIYVLLLFKVIYICIAIIIATDLLSDILLILLLLHYIYTVLYYLALRKNPNLVTLLRLMDVVKKRKVILSYNAGKSLKDEQARSKL